jgi:sugar/nucleoside kinase (ribokinase family)
MKKVLTIGSATQDIFIEYQSPQAKLLGDNSLSQTCSYLLIAEGCKIEVTNLLYTTGGGATNSAASFKKLGFEVASFFQIGDDQQGKEIIQTLNPLGIDLNLVQTTQEHQTGRSFILPSPIGNRPILAYRGANAFLKETELPLAHLNNFDLLYITSLSGQSSSCLKMLAKTAQEKGVIVVTNPGKSQLATGAEKLKAALPYISIFLCNATEAAQLMHSLVSDKKEYAPLKNSSDTTLPQLLQKPLMHKNKRCDLHAFFKLVHDSGPSIVVVTNGAEGVYLSDKKNIYFQESRATKVVSTVGAGDAFGSTFVASLLQNFSIEQALKYGVCNAASVINYAGAKEGLLTFEDLDTYLKKNPLKATRSFDL